MVVINKIPENCCIENFIERLRNQQVAFTDDGVRRVICAMAYYNGIRFEVVKKVEQRA
jgi:hypothetical protein